LKNSKSNFKLKYTHLYIATFFTIFINHIFNWPILKYSGIKGPKNFVDLEIILRAAECYKKFGINIYNFHSGSCVYNYGSNLLRFLSFFHLFTNTVNIFGLLLIALTILSIIEIVRLFDKESNNSRIILLYFLICSPPIMLQFERANLDGLIFIFTGISINILARVPRLKILVEIFIIYVSTFKFYTIGSSFLGILSSKKHRSQTILLSSLIFMAGIQIISDVSKIIRGFSIPNPTYAAYGSLVIGKFLNKYLGFEFTRLDCLALGLLPLILGILILDSLETSNLQLQLFKKYFTDLNERNLYSLRTFSVIYVCTFFTSMNFVYRLIFVVPLSIFLITGPKPIKYILYVLVYAGFWFSYETFLFELLGDLSLFILAIIVTWIILPDIKFLKSKFRN
jgi:hypothetical protein